MKAIIYKYHLQCRRIRFELPDGSYSVWNIQGFLEYIIKIHETVNDNPPINKHVHKMENRVLKQGNILTF